MYTWVYTQYGSLEESVRTEQTRGNLHAAHLYRVEVAWHGQFASEYNKLDASKLEEQGTCYVKDGHKAIPRAGPRPAHAASLLKQDHRPERRADRRPSLAAAVLRQRDVPRRRHLAAVVGHPVAPAGGSIPGDSPQYQAAIAQHPHEVADILAHAAESAGPPPGAEPGLGDGRSAAEQIAAELAATYVPDDWKPPRCPRPRAVAQKKAAFAAALAGAHERGGITPQQPHRRVRDEPFVDSSDAPPALGEDSAVMQLEPGSVRPGGRNRHPRRDQIRSRHARLICSARPGR